MRQFHTSGQHKCISSSVELKHLCWTDTFVLKWRIFVWLTHLCWTDTFVLNWRIFVEQFYTPVQHKCISATQMCQLHTKASVPHPKSLSSTRMLQYYVNAPVQHKALNWRILGVKLPHLCGVDAFEWNWDICVELTHFECRSDMFRLLNWRILGTEKKWPSQLCVSFDFYFWPFSPTSATRWCQNALKLINSNSTRLELSIDIKNYVLTSKSNFDLFRPLAPPSGIKTLRN